MKQSHCKWLARDEEGRPRCQHGWAIKQKPGVWLCREKHRLNQARYRATEKGRAAVARYNASDGAHASKSFYDSTRFR